jgi:hypothetical protein
MEAMKKDTVDTKGHVVVPRDKVGTRIEEGSYVVYGHALGRCAALRIGKILDYEFKGFDSSYDRDTSVWAEDTSKPIFYFSVWGVDEGWNREPKLTSTKGTLQFADRMMVVDYDTLPFEYKKLLAPLTKDSKSVRTKTGVYSYEYKVIP